MIENPWVSEKDASRVLGVSDLTLKTWREIGYLKPGTHWRSAPNSEPVPWTPEVIYHLRWCSEMIEYWRQQDVPMNDLAA